MRDEWNGQLGKPEQHKQILNRGFDAFQQRGKDAGLRERATFTATQSAEKPLLTKIAGEKTEIGGLMYDMPASKILRSIRNAERKVFAAFKKKNESAATPSESTTSGERTKTAAETAFVNFCKEHRSGHIEGLARVSQTDLLKAILVNASDKPDQEPKELAYQAAVTFEVSGENNAQRSELKNILAGSDIWKSRVLDTNITNGLEIPGLSSTESEMFPGATRFEVPPTESTPADAVLNPLFETWRSVVANTTEQRANAFIAKSRPVAIANNISGAVEAI